MNDIKIIIRGDEETFNMDYYLLITAPILICSESSFCSTAAVAIMVINYFYAI